MYIIFMINKTKNMNIILKITGKTEEQFQNNLENFLNVAAVICNGGYLPEEHYRERLYFKEPESKRYQLSALNNHWLNIKEEKRTYIIVEFNFRYDSAFQHKTTITNLMATWFDYVEIIE